MLPFDITATEVDLLLVAENDENRNAICICVIDCHRGMLQTHGAMGHDQERFAFDLEVPVGHCDRRLFVAASDPLRVFIAAIVNEGFLQATEARTRVGTDEIKTQALQDIRHEIRARPVSGVNIDSGSRGGRFQCDLAFGWRGVRFAVRVGPAVPW
jgi:hypothetical protein